MKVLFELSKQHSTIPKEEIISCLSALNISYVILDSNENILLIDGDVQDEIKSLGARLSHTFFIDEFLFSCSPSLDEIKENAIKNLINKPGSVAIKYTNRSSDINSQLVISTLGEQYTRDRVVNLNCPDILIRVLITDNIVYVGVEKAEIDRRRFENRRVQHRPFFSPISLHPKVALALVNLSGVCRRGTLLDPFCGTGGILLEAGLIGVNVVGSDIEEKMIDGCTKTLDFYKISNYKLFCCDISDINTKIPLVDAVATDLPYGKSTTTKGENILDLYDRAFKTISNVLKEGGRAVVGLSDIDMIPIGEKYLSLDEKHSYRVHRSLTRYFCVYTK